MHVFRSPAGAVAAPAVSAAVGPVPVVVLQVGQRCHRPASDQIHRAAVPAITAIRAAPGHELLVPERQAAIAAVAGQHPDLDLVDELHADSLISRRITGSPGIGFVTP